jgi:hypothetical protein
MKNNESGVVSNDSERDQRTDVMPCVLPPEDVKSVPAAVAEALESASEKKFPGIVLALGLLPAGALITEQGLARIMGKCVASIKAAVTRGEFPRPSKTMGKNLWTVGALLRHIEARIKKETEKYLRLGT